MKTIAKQITTITHTPSTLICECNWKFLNNSWADQTEFEDIRKHMLLRMAYKLMKC